MHPGLATVGGGLHARPQAVGLPQDAQDSYLTWGLSQICQGLYLWFSRPRQAEKVGRSTRRSYRA